MPQPVLKGVYCLDISVTRTLTVCFGAVGERELPAGRYAYIGSALNNLGKRVARHQRKEKKLRWHIDYLLVRPEVEIAAVWYLPTLQRRECVLARWVARHGECIQGVGSSDCACPAHLIRLNEDDPPNFAAWRMKCLQN